MEEQDIKELIECLLEDDYLGVAGVLLMNGCCGCPYYPEQCNSVPGNCIWIRKETRNDEHR